MSLKWLKFLKDPASAGVQLEAFPAVYIPVVIASWLLPEKSRAGIAVIPSSVMSWEALCENHPPGLQ